MASAPEVSAPTAPSSTTSLTMPGPPRRPLVSLLDYGAGNVRSVRYFFDVPLT